MVWTSDIFLQVIRTNWFCSVYRAIRASYLTHGNCTARSCMYSTLSVFCLSAVKCTLCQLSPAGGEYLCLPVLWGCPVWPPISHPTWGAQARRTDQLIQLQQPSSPLPSYYELFTPPPYKPLSITNKIN